MATKQKKIGGKRYDAIFKTVEKLKPYTVEEAIELAKKNATCKFDETIEATINLNILPKHSIRDTLSFPNSFGKEKRVVVFAQGEKADEAKNAGAIEVGFEDLISKIRGGYTDFDVAISTPDLYEDDFKKIDTSGRISALYHSIPAQLSKDSRKYRITTAIGKKNNTKAEELLYELIDSKTILPCYNSTNPRVSLADTKDFDSYKLYLSDTGLFVTLLFIDLMPFLIK